MNRKIEASDERRIVLTNSWDNDHAVIATREFAAVAGFSKTDQVMIATAASELSTNILRYVGKGELLLQILRESDRIGIEILALDKGAGINDVEKAMQDGFSTMPGSLGLGLPSVKRIMDEFEIESTPEKGTRIMARKWRRLGKS